jgi:alkanesulfonate monooxygenase SsuD/methylene tetrahydromethanopterin reductase-like flavin-dependent oxidoreductase (luciferase family)
MDIGLFSNGIRHRQIAAEAYAEDLHEVLVADEMGYREAWIAEHIGLDRPDTLPVPDLLIAKAAGLTKQIKLGVAVRLLPLYHPVDVATQAATCDHLLEGRYLFGFGGGGPKAGMEQRGLDRRDRHERMIESFDLILKCWTTPDPFDYQGQFFGGEGIHVLPKPYQKPHMPIGVASATDSIIEWAAQRGYVLMNSRYDTPDVLKRKSALFERASLAAGQPAPRRRFTVCHQVYVADSVAEAKAHVRAGVDRDNVEDIAEFADRHLKYYIPAGKTVEDVTFDDLVDQRWFILGDPDTVYRGIMRLYEEVGGFGTLLIVTGKDWTTREQSARSLRLFAEHVMPRLATLDPDAEVPSPQPSPAAAGEGGARIP